MHPSELEPKITDMMGDCSVEICKTKGLKRVENGGETYPLCLTCTEGYKLGWIDAMDAYTFTGEPNDHKILKEEKEKIFRHLQSTAAAHPNMAWVAGATLTEVIEALVRNHLNSADVIASLQAQIMADREEPALDLKFPEPEQLKRYFERIVLEIDAVALAQNQPEWKDVDAVVILRTLSDLVLQGQDEIDTLTKEREEIMKTVNHEANRLDRQMAPWAVGESIPNIIHKMSETIIGYSRRIVKMEEDAIQLARQVDGGI
ncbi:hypothetical protein LCGC14_0444000 [marine sediment metagenome]|uniref:Uncharacterized protein n=1 Tax=marine sediment metagenome TaxID=412755 RepID=A0A0F9V6E2_9ZZZZ